MLKSIDFNESSRTPMPDVISPRELSRYDLSPERHEAYKTFWNSITYAGVLANTAMWLYI